MIRPSPLRAALAFGLLGLGAAPPTAQAQGQPQTQRSDVRVLAAWSRPVPAGLPTGVVYMTVGDTGAAPDRLTGASTPIAQGMALHRSTMTGGVMSMQPVPGGLEIPAHGEVRLEPAGYHFMLTGLKHGLALGARFPVTLTFAHAPPQTIQVTVRDSSLQPPMAGAMAPPRR